MYEYKKDYFFQNFWSFPRKHLSMVKKADSDFIQQVLVATESKSERVKQGWNKSSIDIYTLPTVK